MPVLQANNISYQFDNGETLLASLSFSLCKKRVGLVGRNGSGKSLLASILVGDSVPTSGTLQLPTSVAIYRQQTWQLLQGNPSVVEFLGKAQALDAHEKILSGDCSTHHFELLGEQWDLPDKLAVVLKAMGLPEDPRIPCGQLSGGQLARLRLWKLFEADVDLLILDEPSNHLDMQGRQWLSNACASFSGAILLISHDRALLRDMEEIWELSTLGLKIFGGNYDEYLQQKRTELIAVERHLISVTKQQKHLKDQAQRNREKAEQRASQGNKLRQDGSQPKTMLDFKKGRATAQASHRNKNQQLRQTHLQMKAASLQSRTEHLKGQRLYLEANQGRPRMAMNLVNAVLPFGVSERHNLQVHSEDKLHLSGRNGCGKSTLLKTLSGEFSLLQGRLSVNVPLYYLDQHFGVVRPRLSVLDNISQQCQGMQVSIARTLLAGIGFRGDKVFRLGGALSGGEKMKLAMLIASHQKEQPLLLLDEPDNHLDLDSKILLADALRKYPGGYVLVSHDIEFVREAGVNRQYRM